MSEGETKSVFEVEPYRSLEACLDAEAEADYQAGRIVPHERVREWLRNLAEGQKTDFITDFFGEPGPNE